MAKGTVAKGTVGEVVDTTIPTVAYTKEEKAVIKKLTGYGIELTGEESGEELNTALEAYELENGDDVGEAEVVDGVPNKLPVRTESILIAGKAQALPIFFVATVKGGKQALYDYEGRRVSPAYGATDRIDGGDATSEFGTRHIAKAAAKFNAMRRRNIIPGEKHIG
ncbi:MAG: hypothetical protein RBG13Loki_0378 [Promethearchaeota archaeon CR_4]|nr:MAG: hypothetical protein RBG13Loki_0378 [Candidatus Lokiarchaeota archaeon CR_4]